MFLVVFLSLMSVDCKMIPERPTPSQCLGNVLNNVPERSNYLIQDGSYHLEDAFKGRSLIRADQGLLANLAEAPEAYWIALQSIDLLKVNLAAIVESPGYKLAMFVVFTDQARVERVSEIIWKFRLPDSLIVSPKGVYALELINCGASVRPVQVCACQCKDALQAFDFKSTFTGCPLRVLWVRYPPYMYEPNQTWGWKGIFVAFLDAVSHAAQRPIQIAPDDADYVDEVYQGYSYDSVLRDLQHADLFIGTADTRTAELFYLSPIIVGDYMMIVAPRALVDYWNHLRRALSIRLLSMFGLMFISMASVVFGLGQFGSARARMHRMADIMMLLYGACVGICGHARLPKYSGLRIFLGPFLIVLMVLSFYLQGSLISVLSGATYEPPISSVEELVESGLPFKLNELFKLVFEFGTGSYQKKHMVELTKRMEVLDEPLLVNILDTMIREKNFASLMIYGEYIKYGCFFIWVKAFMFMRPNLDGTFGFFPVGTINVCFAMGKNAYSSPRLNVWISRALESGFFEKYKRLHHFQLALKWNVEARERNFVVSWDQVGPALKILEYGYMCALFVLLLEVLYSKLRLRLFFA